MPKKKETTEAKAVKVYNVVDFAQVGKTLVQVLNDETRAGWDLVAIIDSNHAVFSKQESK